MYLYEKLGLNLQEVQLYLRSEVCSHTTYPMHWYVASNWIYICIACTSPFQSLGKFFVALQRLSFSFDRLFFSLSLFHKSRSDSNTHSSVVEARSPLRCLFCLMKMMNLFLLSQNGDVCISILHPPVDDPQSGELPSERWNPTQNVR